MSKNYVGPIYIKRNDFNRLCHLMKNVFDEFSGFLEQELDRAEVVEDIRQFPKKVVSMYSNVVFQDLNSKKKRSATLVYPNEADVSSGRISVLSPAGTALLGVSEGEVVSYQTAPNKYVTVKLLEVNGPSTKQ